MPIARQQISRPHVASSVWSRTTTRVSIAVLAFMLVLATVTSQASDWPTYLRDNSRGGSTPDTISLPLNQQWVYAAPAEPRMAWAGQLDRTIEGKDLRDRITFDDALHVAIVSDRVYFGSSIDHHLYCVNRDTGQQIWKFCTGGPIRLAPTVADGKVFFGSDDGYAYCLDAQDGSPVWKLRAGPSDEALIGRGEMISRWPVRTGILIDDGIAYFGAGVFPHENIYLLAVNAADGSVIWKQDNISQTDAGRNDLSPQGYLLANSDTLFFPSGRSLPAAISRENGEMAYKASAAWRTTAGGVVGGSQALLADGQIYCWGDHHVLALDQSNGKVGFGWFTGDQMAVVDDVAYVLDSESILGINRVEYAVGSRKRHELELEVYQLSRDLRSADEQKSAEIREQLAVKQTEIEKTLEQGVLWKTPCTAESALIVAGDKVIAGGQDRVIIFQASDGQELDSLEVDGEVRGLAVSDGRLVASTKTGRIYCFSQSASTSSATAIAESHVDNPYPEDELTNVYERAAQEIIKLGSNYRGYCLVLGSERGRLAYELAKRTDLKIYGVEPDRAKVEESRRLLASAGLYGTRITIHHADLSPLPYSSFFANLIVSDSLLLTGEVPGDAQSVVRHLKPLGGKVVLGRTANAPSSPAGALGLSTWLRAAGLGASGSIESRGNWAMLTRQALPGAGNWSHQYAEPGNTAASDDRLVRGGMGVLWFGDPGPGKMVNRHESAVGPVSVNGRLFVQGQESIMAYDAYNGQFLWEVQESEAVRTGVFKNENPGNLVASDNSLFVMIRGKCVEFDAATGNIKATYGIPDSSGDETHEWGYLAYQNGLLFGTATRRNEIDERQRRRGKATIDATDAIFAIDTRSQQLLWSYTGKTIAHHTIAIGPERVFFIDSSITSEERAALLRQDKSELQKLTGEELKRAEQRMKNYDVRLAVALDAKTGKKLWSKPVDVTDCSEIGTGGGKLTLMFHNNVLLLCGANANGHYWKQFMSGEFSRRRLVALSAEDGQRLWAKDANYRHRPIIVEDRVIAEPWGFDLYSGAQQMREHPLTGALEPWSIMRSGHHCGMISASPNMLLFRSGFTGYYDLQTDTGTSHFAGHRTGCWINMIPANGLLMIPEASAGCVCLFSIASTIVMEPREDRTPWAIYSSVGAQTPVKHMALNLGAPGDRRDAHGKIWLAYPRPAPSRQTSLDLALDIEPQFQKNGGYASLNEASLNIAGTESPWLFASTARGLTSCSIPVLGKTDDAAVYSVKLHFAEVFDANRGSRVFDIVVQGQTAVEDFDIVAAAEGTAKAVIREIPQIRVTDNLQIELRPKNAVASPEAMPLLSAIEIVRTSPDPTSTGAE